MRPGGCEGQAGQRSDSRADSVKLKTLSGGAVSRDLNRTLAIMVEQ